MTRQRAKVLPVPDGETVERFYLGAELEAGELGDIDMNDTTYSDMGAVLFIPDSLGIDLYIPIRALELIDEQQEH